MSYTLGYIELDYANVPIFSGSILRHPQGAGLVILEAMQSNRFLAINSRGQLVTTVSISQND